MSSTIYTLKRTSEEKFSEIYDMLLKDFNNIADISYSNLEQTESGEVMLLVCEKYYFRNNSMAVLTLQCVCDYNRQTATLVGTGGGAGMLNMSFGANGSFADKAKDILSKYGFRE